jgi:radical SAM superfamily enzyme YgiQ (UPF0313 family)
MGLGGRWISPLRLLMRVLLVYSNRARLMEPAPPIGVSYVATATRRAGHDVRFLDLMNSRQPERDLEHALREFQPEVVGLSFRNIDNIIAQRVSWHLNEVHALVELIRQHSPARIVVGGPAASILGKNLLQKLDADFVIVGEGEIAFPRLLAALSSNGCFAKVNGLCYRENGVILYNDPVKEETFGASGMEDWIQWRPYERAGGAWSIHTKRGCPLACAHCNYPVMEGQQLRCRQAGDVVDEIERVKAKIAPRTFEFSDSTFNVPESHAVGICEEILRRNLRVNLSAVSFNPIATSRELYTLMKRAGFCSLVISPDAASETMLYRMGKGFGVDRVREAAALARELDLPCTWFFLLGGPGETRETVEQTVSFVEQHLNWKRFLTIFITGVRLFPGTPVTLEAIASGYIQADCDLSRPVFYFSPGLDENWVLGRISQAIARCPTIVHAAEQRAPIIDRVFMRALYWCGAIPPYYRYLPAFLRLPPLPMLRSRHNGVQARGSTRQD